MIDVKHRDVLLDRNILNAPEQTILVTTNSSGAMGKGLALDAKLRHPHIYKIYRHIYSIGELKPETLITIPVGVDKQVLLFNTKIHWRDPSPVDLILTNLDKLACNLTKLKITSLAMPPLGMANGWLKQKEKDIVTDAIYTFGHKVDIQVTYYRDRYSI